MQQGNLKHHRWHGLWTEGSGQLETSSPVRTNSAGTGQPGRRRGKPNWKRQETGQPGNCSKRLNGSMHVSMNYKGIRKTPGAQASGVFDFGTEILLIATFGGRGIACGGWAARQRQLGAAMKSLRGR